MNTHLSQEDFILSYYGELDARAHLGACDECRNELARLARVLDQVTPIEVPEPGDDYESRVWDRLSWRLRGEKRRVQRTWVKWAAAAAVVILSFIAGFFMKNRNAVEPEQQIAGNQPEQPAPAQPSTVQPSTAQPSTAQPATNSTTQQQRDRILLVVVSDHFDESERMLVELTNLTPGGETDITHERERAEELLASNRLYRRTAVDRGEGQVATLLDELEPVLMQLAHAPSQVTEKELRSIQKRVETKGLVFKLRVVRADVRATAAPRSNPQPSI